MCPVAWQIQDHMKIGIQLAQLHKNQTLFQGDKVSPKQSLHMFLRKTAGAGLLAVEGGMANAHNVPVNEQGRNELSTQLVYHGMAGAMARNHNLLLVRWQQRRFVSKHALNSLVATPSIPPH